MEDSISVQSGDGTRERFALNKDRVTIGRSRESDIFLADQWLSRQHAEIRRRSEGWMLVDLGSKNGTLLNGTRVQDARFLRPGDVITLGEHVLTFTAQTAYAEPIDEAAPEGTRMFSARELSDVATGPVADPEQLARQNRLLSVLVQSAKALLQHRPLNELFEQILDLLFAAVPAERAAILLVESGSRDPVIKASRSRSGGEIARVSRSIARRVLEDRKVLILPNLMEDADFRGQDSILSSGIRSALCAPLWFTSSAAGEDAVIGLVYLDSMMRSHSFGDEDAQVVGALANVAAAKIENVRLLEESLEKRRLEEDMRIAAEIQRGLLPRDPPVVPGYGLVGSNRPCRAVGGDYYDFGSDNGQLLLALGDVSGKGTGAALLMTVLRVAVRGHWNNLALPEAMARINRTVCQNIPTGKFITFFLARLDPQSGCLNYVNAGHNPPMLVRAGGRSQVELRAGGMVLGFFESVEYEEGSEQLFPGDSLLIFSDGVTETWNAQDEEYGEVRLAALAARTTGLDAPALQQALLSDLDLFAGGVKAADDRTLIVLKRH